MHINIHKNEERGTTSIEWLQPRFSFSFADFHNPERMGFGKLRVLNEDTIAAGKGFDTHPHENMEIVTFVLEGALEHKDSMGNEGIIKPGDIQRMSAGSGILHSEYNHSKTEPAHVLQVWVETKEMGIKPSYEQKSFSEEEKKNTLLKVVSGKKGEAVYLHQNAAFFLGKLDKGKSVSHTVSSANQGTYVFVIEGAIEIEGKSLSSGDAAAITETKNIEIKAKEQSHVLAIEVPL